MSRGPWLTAAFKAEVWRRWQAGETCSEIGRTPYKRSRVIHGVISRPARRRGALLEAIARRQRNHLHRIVRRLLAKGQQVGNRVGLHPAVGPVG